jgi:hypothetical protein
VVLWNKSRQFAKKWKKLQKSEIFSRKTLDNVPEFSIIGLTREREG